MKIRSGLITALALGGLLPLSALASDKPAPDSAAAKAKKVEIQCESTSSRIRRTRAEDCAKATQPTTNHYKHELDGTGQAATGDALKKLDPRFR